MKTQLLTPLVIVCALAQAIAAPVINEFVAENQHGLTDQDGDHSDWIEIHNPDATPANMSGWYLTDNSLLPQKWALPAVTIPPGGFLIVFASGKDRAVAGQELHANFSLEASGEYLALSQPGGAGVTTQFSPLYPPQRDGYSYGRSEDATTANVLAAVTPAWIVPTNAGALAADWKQATMVSSAGWPNGTGTGAVGYETAPPPPSGTANVARMAGALTAQSSNYSATLYLSSNGNNGNYGDFTHTLGNATDPNPWWLLTLPSDQIANSITFYNRSGCCPERLRDITLQVLDAADNALYTSPVLNPNNTLNGPATITLDLIALTGSPVTGRKVKISRAGAASGPTENDRFTLSLGEVEVQAATGGVAGDFNLAPGGTAAQTTTLGAFTANLGINNSTGDFTHTLGTDSAPKWTLNLGSRKILSKITLANRVDCCGSRLRDITIVVKDQDNSTVTYTSPLLNPENTGYAFPNGPATLEVDFAALTGGYIVGQYLEISRTVDPDLSGTQGQGNADEANVLSLGEVTVTGNNFGSYAPLITTDVKTAMYNVNTSAFARWPFTSGPAANVASLKLKIRYDDGFIAFLNGVEIARRNATGVTSGWNSTATGGDRDDGAAINFEEIDVTAFKSALNAGGNNVLAIQGLTSAANDPDFLLQPQLIMDSVTVQSGNTYLRTATPGALNDSTWFLDFVTDTSFSLQRGFYSSAQVCTLSTFTEGAQIYYTTNGAEPTAANGTLYTTPINISQTTVLRARAFKADWEPTNVDTQTYLFLADVIAQQPNGAPPTGWPTSPVLNAAGQSQALNYGMDPNVRTLYGDAQLIAALQQIPSISLVTEQANLTHPLTGIYTNAYGHGEDWERPASIEWLDPAKPAGVQGEFQHNCGLRIRGGYSRNPQYVKHAFRVYFRDSYSVPKLNYPIFGDAGTSEHDVIDLATSQNYSWPREVSTFETLVRDPFARTTLLATGSPAKRNRYVHLYLNGLYWGLFYFDERPLAGYGEAYFGGSKDDYDVIKTSNHIGGFTTEATDGYMTTLPGGANAPWRDLWLKHRAFATAPGVTQNGNPDLAAYFNMLGRNADGTRNPALPVLVDVDSLIDYMLVIFYTGDGDAPLSSFLGNDRANNWFAMKNRNNPDMGFVFFNHDAEHTLGTSNAQNDRTGPFNGGNQTNFSYSNPQWIFQDLAFSPEFRMRVADRAHKHFFNGGAMTTAVSQTRMDGLAAQINLAIKAYSQRWGDVVKTPAYNATDWTNSVAVARNYLNNREATVVNQLRAYNLTTSYPDATAPLYPLTAAPVFSQFGGNVLVGFQLTITAPAGTIYYTTNGTDPRAVGGAIAGTSYSSPLTLTQSATTVKARAFNGSVWSALTEATFFSNTVDASSANLVIGEIHYHPADPNAAEITAGFTDADDFEFIELVNIGATSVNLTGCYFASGLDYTFPVTVLAPGARLVLARNAAAFQMRYGTAAGGEYGGGLSNGGERLWLKTPSGATIRDFSFGVSAPWPPEPDGFGPSLVLRQPQTNPDHTLAANWRASYTLTPGGAEGTSYAAWKAANGVTNDQDDGDHDGLGAFLEYATGGNLSTDSHALLPKVTRSGANVLLTVRRNLLADDLTLLVEISPNLATWTPDDSGQQPARTTANGIETLTYTFPLAANPNRHFRVKYQAP